MENNNFIDNEFEMMKAEITQEVMTTLAEKNVDVISNDYDAGVEIVNLIEDYNNSIKQIDDQISYNSSTFREDVAKMKNLDLYYDKQDMQREAIEKIDKAVEKQQYLHQQQIKDIQASQEYKLERSEALGVLNLLKDCKIPTEQLLQIIDPMIRASDTTTLGIAHTLLQGNPMSSYAVERSIEAVKDMTTNNALAVMADTMKEYVRTNNDTLSYWTYMSAYGKSPYGGGE